MLVGTNIEHGRCRSGFRRNRELPHIVLAKNYKYMCSDPGQELIIKDIKGHNLNRIVAACSPRIHELTFRNAVEKAGINPYLFDMADSTRTGLMGPHRPN